MKRYLSLGLICGLLGFVMVVQARTLASKAALSMYRHENTDEIVSQFITVSKERDRLQEELRVMRDMATQAATHANLQQQVRQDRAATGLAPVQGRGVIVTLDDSRSAYHIQEIDLFRVLNVLRASGAEAIAIGDVRLTERTRITAEPGKPITINGESVGHQIIISAIGDPDVLSAGLLMRVGILEELRLYYEATVSPAPDLHIPATTAAAIQHTYARPAR
jgi:uncharacterized protein YlxW (UPF0749 family)